jgi:hypothetical protein
MTDHLRKALGLALALAAPLLLAACAAGKPPAEDQAIEGIAIQDGTVIALPGYYIQPNPVQPERGESAVLLRLGAPSVEGKFDCTCGDDNSGGNSVDGCRIRIVGNTMKCQETVCKECNFVVDIGSLTQSIAQRSLPCAPDSTLAISTPVQAGGDG